MYIMFVTTMRTRGLHDSDGGDDDDDDGYASSHYPFRSWRESEREREICCGLTLPPTLLYTYIGIYSIIIMSPHNKRHPGPPGSAVRGTEGKSAVGRDAERYCVRVVSTGATLAAAARGPEQLRVTQYYVRCLRFPLKGRPRRPLARRPGRAQEVSRYDNNT